MWLLPSKPGLRRELLVLLILLAAFLPFLNKPFHIDDPVFLDIARAIRFPVGAESGYQFRHMGAETSSFNPYLTTHPPGIPYLLKVVAWVAGGYKELPLHASFLVFPLLLALGTGALASRVGVDSWAATLAVLANAALLPSAHTVMADVPALALWTVSSLALLASLEGSRGLRVAAAAGLALACLCAYQMLLLVPLLLIFTMRDGRNSAALTRPVALLLLPMGTIAIFVAALSLAGWQPLEGPLTQIRAGWDPARLAGKLASIPIFCGLALLPFLPWLVAGMRRARIALGIAIAAAAAEAVYLWQADYPAGETVWLAVLAFAGVFALLAAARSAMALPDRRLGLFLAGSIGIVLVYNAFLLPFGAARYLMPLVPPAVVLLAHSLPSTRAQLLTGVLTAVIGVGVAVGDYVLASAYRDFARQVATTVGNGRDRVWFIGEWGMNHYMSSAGFRYLTRASNEPRKGDLVMFAEAPRLWNPSPELAKRLELIDVREVRSSHPVRVMNSAERTGYYSHLWGHHPVLLSTRPVERFGVFRVVR